MIRTDAVWLSTEPLDMRAGPDTALARVIEVFGQARTNHAYLFANKRGNRMKILIVDDHGIWLLARRLHTGYFKWSSIHADPATIQLKDNQLAALITGLPWQQIGQPAITCL